MRITIYIVLALILVSGIYIKKNQIIKERSIEAITTISLWKKNGKPVDVKKIKKENLNIFTRITGNTVSNRVIQAFVSPSMKNLFQINQKFHIKQNEKTITGVLSSISKKINVANGLYKIILKTHEKILEQNENLAIYVLTETYLNKFISPNDAIISQDDGDFLWVLKSDQAVLKKVSLGTTNGKETIIAKGIEEEDQIVIHGMSKLKQGDLINIHNCIDC